MRGSPVLTVHINYLADSVVISENGHNLLYSLQYQHLVVNVLNRK
jgi:hypothetical protein